MADLGSDEGRSGGLEFFELSIDRLELLEKVGSGCTAEVYRGKMDQEIEVAIKVIDWNKSTLGSREQSAFDREVAIMPNIHHDNLVRFLGVCSLGRPFRIVTEFCSGGCCFELLHNSEHIDLRWVQQFKMCKDVAYAMKYLHAFNPQIVHRDLKSLNLLLRHPVRNDIDEPFVKVSDFGLSRMKDKSNGHDTWGKLTIAAGTSHWMAPEVCMGVDYDEKVDVYSYAMILFEIICREIPFEDAEPAQVTALSCQGHRPDLEAVPPDCPQLLKDIMITSWHHDSKMRPTFDTICNLLDKLELSGVLLKLDE